MQSFNSYYTDERIILYLCKIRIKYSRRRHKKLLLDNLTSKNYRLESLTNDYDEEITNQLQSLMPPRRLWLTKGQRTYKSNNIKKEKIKINTDDKNIEILFNTIKKFRKEKPDIWFIVNLNKFIKDVQNSIEDENYKIISPDILPELKEKSKGKIKYNKSINQKEECRPISRFYLKDRIIISITNKFLTYLFDDYFEKASYAFRAPKEINGESVIPNHHKAIDSIIDYKKTCDNKVVYVAECDMKKFFDTVNHETCLYLFNLLIQKAKEDYPYLELKHSIDIFNAYLNCYSFKENVDSKNEDDKYWLKQKDKNGEIINGKFPWVQTDISMSEYYRNNNSDRIGVPQGGALSGLIANIVLDVADKKLMDIKGLLYVRYCDDMILMHTEKDICRSSINIYLETINELNLFNHDFKRKLFKRNLNFRDNKNNKKRFLRITNIISINRSFKQSLKPFWDSKSRGPYRWGKLDIKLKTFPWIGFVGYEIKYDCSVRVRKKSLQKEIEKQNRLVRSIISTIKIKKTVKNDSIIRSAQERLTGMSVGRIKLYNYQNCKNELCWVDGFKNLNFNRYSKSQLKKLDNNKYMQLQLLKRNLGADTNNLKTIKSNPNDEIVDYHKPFSYYYQACEKRK